MRLALLFLIHRKIIYIGLRYPFLIKEDYSPNEVIQPNIVFVHPLPPRPFDLCNMDTLILYALMDY